MEKRINNSTLMEPFILLYDGHTKFFNNVLDSMTDEDAQNRLNTQANHVAWIAGSLVFERYELARLLDNGPDAFTAKHTSHNLFKDHKGLQNVEYPSINEFKKDWEIISPVLKNILPNLTNAQLNSPDPFGMPGGDYTLFDAVTFCIDRESYCIGQIGLYRRLLGYEAMKYD
ncbi:MAG TPA: hypothetical protein VNI52_09540 [Sphingobacteriaceae bacterium]|nr:hypothetical protein [Sphingobacteriaceae bacterium]